MDTSKEQTVEPHGRLNLEHKYDRRIKIICFLNTSRLVILLTEMKSISKDSNEVDFSHLDFVVRVGYCCGLFCVL